MPSSTALPFLNRWAYNRTETAKDTAIAVLWLQHALAPFTVIEVLAGIRGHCFSFLMPTMWAGDLRFENYVAA